MASKLGTSLAALTLALSPLAIAQERGPTFELHGGLGRSLFGDPLDDTEHYNLGLGMNLTDRWGVDLMATQYETAYVEGPGFAADGEQYRLDALYHLADLGEKARPYLAFGAGHQRLESQQLAGGEEEDTLINAGVGIKYQLAKRLLWRTDMRVMNSIDREYTDVAFSTGLSFLFGYSGERATPEPQPEPRQPLDSDNDGVINERDNCPNTPRGARVDNQGCERDSDRDGVVDSKDQCPGTARQYKVDGTGCPIELSENVSIEMRVEFATNSAEVREAYMSEIKKVADFMNQFDRTQVTVEGHTDNTGAAAYNQDLSQRRADSVRQILINRFGLSADRVEAVGYGEERPTASNDTAEGRELNRRVVAEISTDVTRTQTRD